MKDLWFIAISAALAITTTGVVPTSMITAHASAKANAPGAPRKTTRGKPREVRFRSTKPAAEKVPATTKAQSSDKKTERRSSAKSAKAGFPPATTSPVVSSTPKRTRRKTGSGKRVSMTAVAGVPMSGKSLTTAAAGPSGRTSLNVNKGLRAPRPSKVKSTSGAQNSRNGTKKRSRTTRGRTAKSAVKTAGTPSTAKATLNATPQAPVNARARSSGALDAVSTASSVLTRQGTPGGAIQQTAPPRQQGRFRRFIGKIGNALTWN